MSTLKQINAYISSQTEAKQKEMSALHQLILDKKPDCKLWFLDGKNSEGKIVSNPNIGYGNYAIHYADGSTKDFYQIGLSGNTTGISIYIMGLKDKTFLVKTFGERLGKASVTGYCIKFKTIKDINIEVLEEVIVKGFEDRE